MSENWLPTPESINALPEPIRAYIHDLETRADPAGDVRARILAEDTVRALLMMLGAQQRHPAFPVASPNEHYWAGSEEDWINGGPCDICGKSLNEHGVTEPGGPKPNPVGKPFFTSI